MYNSLSDLITAIRTQTSLDTGIDENKLLVEMLSDEVERFGFEYGEICGRGITNISGDLRIARGRIEEPFRDYRGPILWRSQFYWEGEMRQRIIFLGPEFKKIR